MAILQAKDYASRSDLENDVRNKFGLTTDKKEHTIQGTRSELARLQLSDKTTFWGLSCEITDTPTQSSPAPIPIDRGEHYPSSIDRSV